MIRGARIWLDQIATSYGTQPEEHGKDEPKRSKGRMVHVRLPEAMHKKVRIRAAETDKTIQDWVFEAIKRELERQGSEDGRKSE